MTLRAVVSEGYQRSCSETDRCIANSPRMVSQEWSTALETYFCQTKEGAELEKPPGKTQPDFTYDICEGFQGNEEILAVAADLEDAYNRVQFKLLMERLAQYVTCSHEMMDKSRCAKRWYRLKRVVGVYLGEIEIFTPTLC